MRPSARRTPKIEREAVEGILRSLVSINSINPYVEKGAGEKEIAEHIGERLKQLGLKVTMQNVVDGRQNVIGLLRGSGDGPSLMLNGHLDTVGVEGMKANPFEPRVDTGGNLHGRGACDMKGSLSAMIAAIEWVVREEIELRGDLFFTGAVDEEYKARGTMKIAESFRADAAIVGEPTGLDIAIAHKGFVWLHVVTHGRAAHGSVPEEGIDAIEKMGKLVVSMDELRKMYGRARHPLLGTPKIHTSTISGGSEWSVIPERCDLAIERRTLPGENESTVVQEISSLLAKLASRDAQFDATVSVDTVLPPFEESEDATIVGIVKKATKAVVGKVPKIMGVPYWTDAATLKNKAGIPTCLFGPGDIRLAHSRDEYVPLEEVVRSARILSLVITEFCQGGA